MLRGVIMANDCTGREERKVGCVLKENQVNSFFFCLIDLLLNWFRPHVIRVLKINDL